MKRHVKNVQGVDTVMKRIWLNIQIVGIRFPENARERIYQPRCLPCKDEVPYQEGPVYLLNRFIREMGSWKCIYSPAGVN